MSPTSPCSILPGVCENVSQIDGPLPSASCAPSIWYAAVAVPHRKPSGNRCMAPSFVPVTYSYSYTYSFAYAYANGAPDPRTCTWTSTCTSTCTGTYGLSARRSAVGVPEQNSSCERRKVERPTTSRGRARTSGRPGDLIHQDELRDDVGKPSGDQGIEVRRAQHEGAGSVFLIPVFARA